MGSILSIDYGTKRIGLAVSDPSRNFAFPCGVIQNKGLKHVLSCISDIVTQKEIDLIVIGMPYDQRSGEVKKQRSKEKESMEEIVCKFIEQLKNEIKIPVETIDESLSSFAAEERLKETMSAKDLKKFVDQEAARLLLEEFIQKAKP